MGSSGMRTPRTFAALKRLQLQARLGAAAAVSGLPLAAALFALGTTALVVLWAQTAYSPHAPRVVPRQASSQPALPEPGEQGGPLGTGTQVAQEGRRMDEKSVGAQAAPFLSDELPESEGSRKRAVRLSPEEQEREKAEAVYKSNVLRRNEMMHGVRPQPPFREWNAGRLREVFLAAMYPCPHERKLGSPARGKWLCDPDKLKGQAVTIFSCGALEDLSFEAAAFRQLGPRTMVHVFTASLSPKEERRLMADTSEARQFLASFHSTGVVAARDVERAAKGAPPGKEFLTLPQVLSKLDNPALDILKMDCEGCEASLVTELTETFSRTKPPFRQLILEIHHARSPSKTLPILFALEDLGFRLFHVEPDKGSSHRFELYFVHELFLDPTGALAPPQDAH